MKFLLRHWYAGLAMHAILHRQGGYDSGTGRVGVEPSEAAYEAFKYATYMLAEAQKTPLQPKN